MVSFTGLSCFSSPAFEFFNLVFIVEVVLYSVHVRSVCVRLKRLLKTNKGGYCYYQNLCPLIPQIFSGSQ